MEIRLHTTSHFTLVVMVMVSFFGLSEATPCPSNQMTFNVNATPFSLTTPNYPGNYPRPLSCEWKLKALDGHVINIRVLTFDVFPSIFCYRDIVDIFDGKNQFSPVMQSWCGSKNNVENYKTSESTAIITFQAVTEGGSRKGFHLQVWSELEFIPAMGRVVLGTANVILLALSATIGVVFVIGVVIIVIQQIRMMKSEDDD